MTGLPITFVSSLRRGFVAEAGQATTVSVRFGATPAVERKMDVLGPGDATGIDPRQVIRSNPANGATDVESNYLAIVEFDRPDLPWMFSPAPVGGRLVPWMMLVVIDVTERDDPVIPGLLRPVLTADADELGDAKSAWLWAHAQIVGAGANVNDPERDPALSLSRLVCPRRLEERRDYLACVVPTFAAGVAAGLGREVSDALRMASTPAWDDGAIDVQLPVYHQFRFKTGPAGDFEQLVERLHGIPLPPELGVRDLMLDHARSGLQAPTNAKSVTLHAALRPPGPQLPEITTLTGASYIDVLRARLVDAGYDISLVGGDPPPEVGPPIYGQFAAGVHGIVSTPQRPVPPWLAELNDDPRLRVAAGLGTVVVQRNQERYVAEAWRQVEQVLAANRLRRRGEFCVAANTSIYTRWLSQLDPIGLVAATSPTHGRIRLAGRSQTVAGRLRASPVPPEVISVEFRRFTRERGPRGKGLGRIDLTLDALAARITHPEPLVTRRAPDTIGTFEPPSAVWGAARSAEIFTALVPGAQPVDAAGQLDQLSQPEFYVLPTAAEFATAVARVPTEVDKMLTAAGLLPTKVVDDALMPPVRQPDEGRPPRRRRRLFPLPRLPDWMRIGRRRADPHVEPVRERVIEVPALAVERLDPVAIRRVPLDEVGPILGDLRDRGVIIQRPGEGIDVNAALAERESRIGIGATTIDADTAAHVIDGTFRPPAVADLDFHLTEPARVAISNDLVDVVTSIGGRLIRAGDQKVPPGDAFTAGLGELAGALVTELTPERSIGKMIGQLVSGLPAELAETFDPITAAPELSEPTYRELARISNDWILPGLDELEPDTTTLAVANRRFIASFLVGMNHELARELQWREYPTDQRGTYSRQFWVHRRTGQADDQYDLRHELHKAGGLRLAELCGGDEDPLVLIVKGELVHRYPGLIVTAATTRVVNNRRRMNTDNIIDPDFFGLLEPDVLFVGFDELKESTVRNAANTNDAIWIFFAEHFAEPRFGLDLAPDGGGPNQPPTWNEANWAQAGAAPHLTGSTFAARLTKVDGGVDAFQWGRDAADQAWIMLQFPYRRGIPAIDLLPKIGPPP